MYGICPCCKIWIRHTKLYPNWCTSQPTCYIPSMCQLMYCNHCYTQLSTCKHCSVDSSIIWSFLPSLRCCHAKQATFQNTTDHILHNIKRLLTSVHHMCVWSVNIIYVCEFFLPCNDSEAKFLPTVCLCIRQSVLDRQLVVMQHCL